MKTRKLISLLMAIVMVLAVAVPAFAGDPSPNVTDPAKMGTGITTKMTGITTAGEISIVVPTTGAVVLNPYMLKVKPTDGTADPASGTEVQVASAWQSILNKSTTTDVDVTAAVTATVVGNAKLSTATEKPTYSKNGETDHVRTNDVWAYLETEVASAAHTGDLEKPADNLSFVADNDGYQANVLIGSRVTPTKVGKIVKAASNSNSYLNFHINGVANQYADTPWTNKDTVTYSILFTFAPAVA